MLRNNPASVNTAPEHANNVEMLLCNSTNNEISENEEQNINDLEREKRILAKLEKHQRNMALLILLWAVLFFGIGIASRINGWHQ